MTAFPPSLIDVKAAQSVIAGCIRLVGIECVCADAAVGRALAEPLLAAWSNPQGAVSIMDGWAVRAADVRTGSPPVRLHKQGESAAGHPASMPLALGEAVRISTGALLPVGSDAVVAQEQVQDIGECIVVESSLSQTIEPGMFVRPPGSDVTRGEKLLEPGIVLGPADVALAAAAGCFSIPVRRKPTVAILCLGDELVALGTTPAPGQVVSTNGLLLAALVTASGGTAVQLPIVGDDLNQVVQAMKVGLGHDVLLTSGGISAGAHDHVYEALGRLGAAVHVHGVRMRPGKPTTFASVDHRAIFALPGNPASTFVAFELFVRPALLEMLGLTATTRPRRWIVLAQSVRGAGDREHYVRARIDGDRAHPLADQRSGSLRSISQADALVRVPANVTEIRAGERAEVLLLTRHG